MERALEKETRDLDVEIKQMKVLKASYGVTTPQELRHMGDDVDINTLTMEQYLPLIQDNIRPSVVKPEIGDDVEFEINSNFIRELKRKLFKGEIVKAKTKKDKEDMKELVPRDLPIVHLYVPPMPFLGRLKEQKGNPYKIHEIVCMIGNLEKTRKAQEDERDMEYGWDIMVKDVERLKQILTPTVHTLPNLEPVMQPYMPINSACDEAKFVREEEHDYNIPLHDGVMQPLTL
ncbi:hypothetical protein Tco_0762192 [Tanacetum coccineum]